MGPRPDARRASDHAALRGEVDGFANGNTDTLDRNLETIRRSGAEVVVVMSADHCYQPTTSTSWTCATSWPRTLRPLRTQRLDDGEALPRL